MQLKAKDIAKDPIKLGPDGTVYDARDVMVLMLNTFNYLNNLSYLYVISLLYNEYPSLEPFVTMRLTR
jgi:hypothetical protein